MGATFSSQTTYASVLLTERQNKAWTLEYYLMTYTGTSGKEVYGIKIAQLDSNNIAVYEEETYAITDSLETAEMLLHHVAGALVMPKSKVLLDFVDDWFSAEALSRPSAIA